METFAKRLTKALEMNNMTAADLSKATGISQATISNYKSGNYEPKQRRTEYLACVLHVNVAWLMGADVPPAEDGSQFSDNKNKISKEKQDLINKVMQMSDDQVKALANVLSLMNL